MHSQPDLTTLKLVTLKVTVLSTCLLKLTKLDVPMSWLTALIPGRPVKEVVFHERSQFAIPIIDITLLVHHCHQYGH